MSLLTYKPAPQDPMPLKRLANKAQALQVALAGPGASFVQEVGKLQELEVLENILGADLADDAQALATSIQVQLDVFTRIARGFATAPQDAGKEAADATPPPARKRARR